MNLNLFIFITSDSIDNKNALKKTTLKKKSPNIYQSL